MSMIALAAFVTIAGASPAYAQASAPCGVNVDFGSYAMGIDRAAFERVSALLAKDRGVRAVDQRRWGREGEVTLCVRVRRASDMRRLFARIRATIPRDPRGPVSVTTRSGLRFTVSNAP
jgi:hypothetical protein